MIEQAQSSQPNAFNYQAGALQGIVNGQADTWYLTSTTAQIEEVDEWMTQDVARTTVVHNSLH